MHPNNACAVRDTRGLSGHSPPKLPTALLVGLTISVTRLAALRSLCHGRLCTTAPAGMP